MEFEIIIFDNNSRDNSVKTFRKLYKDEPYIQIHESDENLGFGKGNNEAARFATGKYLMFLNSDTVVEDKGILGMLAFLEKTQNAGILGAKLFNKDGTPQRSAGSYYKILNVFLLLVGAERLGLLRYSPNLEVQVDWVSGAAMLVAKKLFEEFSGFDENIFMYMEDMELCYRVRKSGQDIYFYPEVSIKHMGEGSSNRSYAIVSIYQGILYFYKKHMPSWQYKTVRLMLKSKAHLLIKLGTITGNTYLTRTYEKALAVC